MDKYHVLIADESDRQEKAHMSLQGIKDKYGIPQPILDIVEMKCVNYVCVCYNGVFYALIREIS